VGKLRRALVRAKAEWLLRRFLSQASSIDDLVDRVAKHRHRSIQLLPFEFPVGGGLSGMWLALHETDVVVYPSGGPNLQRVAVVGHELGHMLLGHSPAGVAPALARAMPDLDIARYLGRTVYADQAEADAEYIATVILRTLEMQTAVEGSVSERLR